MKSYQTPQKEQARFAESANRRSKDTPFKSASERVKKPHKITRKCLSSSEDMSPEAAKESFDCSTESDISDSYQHGDLSDSFVFSLNPDLEASSETVHHTDSSPLSEITINKQKPDDLLVQHHGSGESNGLLMLENVDVDIVVDFLKNARLKVSNSSDVDLRSKKILDALIKILVEDLYRLPGEGNQSYELVPAKSRLCFLCFVLWVVSVSIVLYSNSGTGSSFPKLSPT